MQLRWISLSSTRYMDRFSSGTLNGRLLPLQTVRTTNFGRPAVVARRLYSSANLGSHLVHGSGFADSEPTSTVDSNHFREVNHR